MRKIFSYIYSKVFFNCFPGLREQKWHIVGLSWCMLLSFNLLNIGLKWSCNVKSTNHKGPFSLEIINMHDKVVAFQLLSGMVEYKPCIDSHLTDMYMY